MIFKNIIQSIKLAGNIELVHQVLQIKYRIRTPTNPENHNDTEGTYFPENIALLQKKNYWNNIIYIIIIYNLNGMK